MDSVAQHEATQRQLRDCLDTIRALASENGFPRQTIDHLAAENQSLRERLWYWQLRAGSQS